MANKDNPGINTFEGRDNCKASVLVINSLVALAISDWVIWVGS